MATATIARPAQALRNRPRPGALATSKRSITNLTENEVSSNKRRKLEPEPYVRDNAHILSKHAGKPPSLVVNLHDDFWRFEGQDGNFGYTNTPMRAFLKHLREGTVPHELLEDLMTVGATFYDNCLIVEVRNHRSTDKTQDGGVEKRGKEDDGVVRFSMHNWNEHITPSPFAPYPKKARESISTPKKAASEEAKAAGEMGPPDSKDGKKDGKGKKDDERRDKSGPIVSTIVLHPTALTEHHEMLMLAQTPLAEVPNINGKKGKDGKTPASAQPPTPSLAAPPTPLSATARGAQGTKDGQKMCLEPADFYDFQANVLLHTRGPLYLEPVRNGAEAQAVLDLLADPLHNAKPPSPKTRKRTTAELAAEDAAAAEAERRMLIMDERIKPAGLASKGAAGEGGQQAGLGAFGRFKTIELVRSQHEEREARKKEEEARLAEQRKAQEEARAAENARLSNASAAAAMGGVGGANAASVNAMNGVNEAQRQAMQQRIQQRQAAMQQERLRQQQLAQQMQNQQAMQAAQQHGHPPGSAGGMMNGQPNPSSMAQPSPIVRQQTPAMNSSPMINNNGFPMQQSGSQQGVSAGSPPRPRSAISQPPSNVNMVRNGSQQQHTPLIQQGTPAMPNRNMSATPAAGMPNRAMTATPAQAQAQRMGPGSPAVGMNGMPNGMNVGTPGGGPMNMATPGAGGHMPNVSMAGGMAHQLTPEQVAMLRQQQLNAQSGMTNGMTPDQLNAARLQAQQQQQHKIQVAQQILQRNPGISQQAAMQQAQQIVMQQQQQQRARQQALQAQHAANMANGGQGSPMPGGGNHGHPSQQFQGQGTPTPGHGMSGMDNQSAQQAMMQARQQQMLVAQQQQRQNMQQLQALANQHGGSIPNHVAQSLPPQLQNLLRQQQMNNAARMRAASAAAQGMGGQQRPGGGNMPSTADTEAYMATLRQQRGMLANQMGGNQQMMMNTNNGMGGMNMGMGGGGGNAGLTMGGQSFNSQGNGGGGDLSMQFAAMQNALQQGQRPGGQ